MIVLYLHEEIIDVFGYSIEVYIFILFCNDFNNDLIKNELPPFKLYHNDEIYGQDKHNLSLFSSRLLAYANEFYNISSIGPFLFYRYSFYYYIDQNIALQWQIFDIFINRIRKLPNIKGYNLKNAEKDADKQYFIENYLNNDDL